MASPTSRRERQIAEVMARHGMAYLAATTGLDRLRNTVGHTARQEPYSSPRELRLALEELGPTFVKLGQIVSTRGDLLPADYRTELAKLQDAAPPFPAEVVRDVLEHELPGGVDAAFASFTFEPLAAASIGQAHAATLHDGTEVVVKLRRPGAVEEVEEDLEILRNWAARRRASSRWSGSAG